MFENGKRAGAGVSVGCWKKVKPKADLKYRLIEQGVDQCPIQKMCKFYGVLRSGYCRYNNHKDIPSKDVALAEMIEQGQRIRGKIDGYRYIQLWLEETGSIYQNPKTVLRIMQKCGLLSEFRRKHWQVFVQSIHRYAKYP